MESNRRGFLAGLTAMFAGAKVIEAAPAVKQPEPVASVKAPSVKAPMGEYAPHVTDANVKVAYQWSEFGEPQFYFEISHAVVADPMFGGCHVYVHERGRNLLIADKRNTCNCRTHVWPCPIKAQEFTLYLVSYDFQGRLNSIDTSPRVHVVVAPVQSITYNKAVGTGQFTVVDGFVTRIE